MAQINIKQIRGESQGSLIFLGTNSVLSENYNRLNWNQNTNQLFINGQLKIQDGNQASGYLLTSDSNGLATWTSSSSLNIATGSGLTNYVTKWTSNTQIATSSIYDYNGRVGIGNTNSQATLHISGNTNSTVFKVDGTSGELFSITDSLQGSLFSVNDISGLPVLEVFSDNTLLMGDFQSRGLYTTKKTLVASGSNTIYSFATASYNGAFIDYTAYDGVNARAGSLNAIWIGNEIQYTETSTLDIGTTTGLTFSFILSGTYAVINAHATSNWTVKSIIRGI